MEGRGGGGVGGLRRADNGGPSRLKLTHHSASALVQQTLTVSLVNSLVTANTDRCSRSLTGETVEWLIKGCGGVWGGPGPPECQASDSCVHPALALALTLAPVPCQLRQPCEEEKKKNNNNNKHPGCLAAIGPALNQQHRCFLLFAGAVNLTKRGRRQTHRRRPSIRPTDRPRVK